MSQECEHPKLKDPPFDETAARGLSSNEVRKRWPRVEEECPDCGARVVLYASFSHFIHGDW